MYENQPELESKCILTAEDSKYYNSTQDLKVSGLVINTFPLADKLCVRQGECILQLSDRASEK